MLNSYSGSVSGSWCSFSVLPDSRLIGQGCQRQPEGGPRFDVRSHGRVAHVGRIGPAGGQNMRGLAPLPPMKVNSAPQRMQVAACFRRTTA